MTGLVGAAVIRVDGVLRAIHEQRGHGTRGHADHLLGEGGADHGNRSHAISHRAAHAERHESAISQARGVNAWSVQGVLEGNLVQHLIEKGNVVGGLRLVFVLVRILSASLAAPLAATPWISTAGVPSSASAGIPASSPGIATTHPSATSRASASPHVRRRLLRLNSYVPLSVHGVGIDHNHAVLVSELVEVRKPCRVAGILVAAVQKNNDWIVLLRVVTLGQTHGEGAGNVIDGDLFLRVLSA